MAEETTVARPSIEKEEVSKTRSNKKLLGMILAGRKSRLVRMEVSKFKVA